MVFSISIGLPSLWLNKSASQPRMPLAKPAMLLAMVLGVSLLLLTILLPSAKPVSSQPPAATKQTPASSAAPPSPSQPAAPVQVPVQVPTPTPVVRPLATPAPASSPPPASKPAVAAPEIRKPPSPIAVPPPQHKPVVPPKTVEPPEVRPETTKDAHKANIFSARCSRLLEKVGSGEPMSNAEQQEMVTKCQ